MLYKAFIPIGPILRTSLFLFLFRSLSFYTPLLFFCSVFQFEPETFLFFDEIATLARRLFHSTLFGVYGVYQQERTLSIASATALPKSPRLILSKM